MNHDTENLSTEQSLAIISKMIHTAKGNFVNASFHFLLWGWVILAANLGHYYLQEIAKYEAPFLVWFVTIPAAIVSMIYGMQQGKRAKVRSHFNSIYSKTWLAFGISLIILLVFFGDSEGQLTLNPIILIIAAMATFVSGISLKFKPLVIGAVTFWLFAILSFWLNSPYQYLVSAVAVLTGYLIPGYMLKYSTK